MKKLTGLFILIFIITLCCTAMLSCGTQYSQDLKYTPNQDNVTCTLIGFGDCTDERIVIPPKNEDGKVVTGLSITSVGASHKNITEIILPESIVSVKAFNAHLLPNLHLNKYEGGSYLGTASNPYYALIYYESRLDSNASPDAVIHPDTVLIANEAFSRHPTLKSAIIPEGVKYIGSKAFSDCDMLTEISIPSTIIRMDKQVFAKCGALESVTIPKSLNEVPEEIFLSCRALKSIIIEDGITHIGDGAFEECFSLEEISIPASVESISFDAFQNCTSLEKVTLNEGLKLIRSSAFANCKNLTEINIPLSVEKILYRVFSGCEKLNFGKYSNGLYLATADNPYAIFIKVTSTDITELELHPDTQKIAESAFSQCKNLTKIAIPKGVTRLGENLFVECESLTEVILPSSLNTIVTRIFYRCIQLKQINFEGTTEQWKAMSDRQQGWAMSSPITQVQCTDGVIQLSTYDKQSP